MTQAHFNFEHELRPPDDYSDLSVFSSPSVTQDVLPHEEVSPPHSLTLQQDEVSPEIPSPSLTPDIPQQDEVSPKIPSPSLTSDVPQIEEVSPVSLDDETIPDHSFETKIIKGKLGAMKGKTRETVSLIIGNHIFRKRNSLKNGTIIFSCNGCEKLKPIKHLYAVACINENGNYELIEWPHSEDHHCWSDGTEALIREARQEMFRKVDEDPSRSINKIYEEVRLSFTGNLDGD